MNSNENRHHITSIIEKRLNRYAILISKLANTMFDKTGKIIYEEDTTIEFI
jgi:hypothetical protein